MKMTHTVSHTSDETCGSRNNSGKSCKRIEAKMAYTGSRPNRGASLFAHSATSAAPRELDTKIQLTATGLSITFPPNINGHACAR